MRFAKRRLGFLLMMAVIAPVLVCAQTTVEEHWSPYNYPRDIPAGTKYHIIVDGDTLWGITATYLGDPLLWPQVYAKNAYILDPNLIYPGDPVFLDIGAVVDDQTISQNVEEDGTPGDGGSDSGEFSDMEEMGDEDLAAMDQDGQGDEDISNVSEVTEFDSDSAEFVILPAGNRADMECSTYLYPLNERDEVLPFDLKISGGENRVITHYSMNDVVYLNKGFDSGVEAGALYSVQRPLRKVFSENRFLGMAIDQVGKVKILTVQANTATAMVLEACFEITQGDVLVPYDQEPIPLITELPTIERHTPFSTEGSGLIVLAEDDLRAFGKGHLTNIDLGIDKNVAPGDIFIIYRKNPSNQLEQGINLPDIFLGHGVALRAGTASTVMKVIAAVSEVAVGDMVVPLSTGDFMD